MDTQEAYRELGLDASATDAQLKSAWRRLVAAWHPDRNPAADALHRMQVINKAYQHIRQLRDGGEPDEPAPEAPPEAADPDDTRAATRQTLVRTVRLSLEDVILGCTRTLRGHLAQTCSACAGTGQRVLAQGCPRCQGSGAVRKPTLFGWLWNEEGCADCGGDGRLRTPCDDCDSSGERQVPYRRRVRFPAGMKHGDVLSVPPSQHGDAELALELKVEIEAHPLFTLDERQVLRCEMPVNGYAWMTGRWVEVPTPDGLQHMRLNREATVYRLAGKGFPQGLRGPRGDFLVKVVPVFPPLGDPEQERLLDKLIARSDEAAEADDTQPLGQWQRTVKRWSGS